MKYDKSQQSALEAIRGAYSRGLRHYVFKRTFQGGEAYVTNGQGLNETVHIDEADIGQFAQDGLIFPTQDLRDFKAGKICNAILKWDEIPPLPLPPIHIPGHGNAIFLQHGGNNVASGVTVTGGSVNVSEAGKLRDDLASLLASSSDPAAREIVELVDGAIDCAAKPGRGAAIAPLLGATLDKAQKLTATFASTIVIVKAIASALGHPLPP